jgi:hypothetical protein
MNNLLVAVVAGAFALGSIATMAQTPAMSPDDAAKAKADKEAAAKAKVDAAPYDKRAWENMTPEERKAWRARKQRELSQTEKSGNPNAPAKGEAISKSAEATKNQPKLSDEAKKKALAQTEKSGNPNAAAKAEAISKSAEATKDQPKLDEKSKQEALKAQEKKSSGQ